LREVRVVRADTAYKRNHKGHKSYTTVYMAASVVKAQGGDPMPVETMQKLGRLVQVCPWGSPFTLQNHR
jgi:hypothetical protein